LTNTPRTIQDPGGRVTLGLDPQPDSRCMIRSVRASFRVTAADLAQTTAASQMQVEVALADDEGDPLPAWEVILIRVGVNQPLSGNQMGTGCENGRVRFQDGGASFADADPPYVGRFKPFGSVPPPEGNGTFERFQGVQAKDSRWVLTFLGIQTPIQVQCWTMEFDLEERPPTPLQRPGH